MSDFVVTQEMIDAARDVRSVKDYFYIQSGTTLKDLREDIGRWDDLPDHSQILIDDCEQNEGAIYIVWPRPETDLEVTSRLRNQYNKKVQEEAMKAEIQQRELAEYKRLAAKYGELK